MGSSRRRARREVEKPVTESSPKFSGTKARHSTLDSEKGAAVGAGELEKLCERKMRTKRRSSAGLGARLSHSKPFWKRTDLEGSEDLKKKRVGRRRTLRIFTDNKAHSKRAAEEGLNEASSFESSGEENVTRNPTNRPHGVRPVPRNTENGQGVRATTKGDAELRDRAYRESRPTNSYDTVGHTDRTLFAKESAISVSGTGTELIQTYVSDNDGENTIEDLTVSDTSQSFHGKEADERITPLETKRYSDQGVGQQSTVPFSTSEWSAVLDGVIQNVSSMRPISRYDHLSLSNLGIEVSSPSVSEDEEGEFEEPVKRKESGSRDPGSSHPAEYREPVKERDRMSSVEAQPLPLATGKLVYVSRRVKQMAATETPGKDEEDIASTGTSLIPRGRVLSSDAENIRLSPLSAESSPSDMKKVFHEGDRKVRTLGAERTVFKKSVRFDSASDEIVPVESEDAKKSLAASKSKGSSQRVLVPSETEMSLSGLAREEVEVDWDAWRNTGGRLKSERKESREERRKSQGSRRRESESRVAETVDAESRYLKYVFDDERRRSVWQIRSGQKSRPKYSLRRGVRRMTDIFKTALSLKSK